MMGHPPLEGHLHAFIHYTGAERTCKKHKDEEELSHTEGAQAECTPQEDQCVPPMCEG